MTIDEVKQLVAAAAARWNVPVEIGLRTAQAESDFNPAAVSSEGAIGVMQLMPATAASLGVDPRDPAQNIEGGMRYLAQMYTEFGDWALALAAYNAGPGRVRRGVFPAETRAYVQRILGVALPSGPLAPGVEMAGDEGADETAALPPGQYSPEDGLDVIVAGALALGLAAGAWLAFG